MPVEAFHYKMPRNIYPCLECGTDVWAKTDMLTHASFARLDRPKERGLFASVNLQEVHFDALMKAVLHAIGCATPVLQLVVPSVTAPVSQEGLALAAVAGDDIDQSS